jgi:hypothetical protein
MWAGLILLSLSPRKPAIMHGLSAFGELALSAFLSWAENGRCCVMETKVKKAETGHLRMTDVSLSGFATGILDFSEQRPYLTA